MISKNYVWIVLVVLGVVVAYAVYSSKFKNATSEPQLERAIDVEAPVVAVEEAAQVAPEAAPAEAAAQ